jgi:hypothetical protein
VRSRWMVVVAGGALFGAVATWLNVPPHDHVLDDSPRRVASLVVNAGAAWAGVAVLGGWALGSVRRGLLGGPLALVPAVVLYYALGAVLGSENADGSAGLIAFFGLVALVVGPALGAAGGLVRRRGVLGLVAMLVVPAGVGLELVWRSSTAGLPPDPARPVANLILVAMTASGVVAAVARRVAPPPSPRLARRS